MQNFSRIPPERVVASILIPVKNGALFLPDTLDSIFRQQVTFKFEVVIVDDGSTDETWKILEKYSQLNPSIRVFQSPGTGVGSALNFGMTQIKSKYVIRIDSDDQMLDFRVQNQVDFMEENPSIGLMGTQIQPISNNSIQILNSYPEDDLQIRKILPFGNAFADPSVIFRSSLTECIGNFPKHLDGAEQYDFWLRVAYVAQLSNLGYSLTRYRVHDQQFTRTRVRRVLIMTLFVQLMWFLGIRQFCIRIKATCKGLEISWRPVSRFAFFCSVLRSVKYCVKAIFK